MKELNYVGKRIIREDSFDKARGKTIYVEDMKRTDMLYAKLVLSQKAHAEIEIDKTEAILVEGIVDIFTHEDVPKVLYNSFEWHSSTKAPRDEYLLNNKARYVGDRIALVIGNSKRSVEEAISKLGIAYKEMEPIIGLEKSTNIAFSKEISTGDYAKAFKDADYIIKDKGTTPKIHHAAIEPHACLAEFNDRGDLVVWSPCQVASQIQIHVSNILNIPLNRVRVIKTIMGGSFGGKSIPILEPIAAFATYKLNRPVMLYMNRTDTILGTVTRNAAEITVETAVNKDGKILGRRVEADIDGGAYNTNAAAVTMALGKKLFRLYEIQDQSYIGKAYYTNTIPGGACRGYGSPQAHAVSEVNIDNVAKKLNMDPCELRLINLVDEGAKDPTGGTDIGNAKIKECIITGMKAFNWKEKRANIKNRNTDRYAYGVGMACGTHGNGYTGAYADYTNVDLRLFADGSAFVKMSIHDLGCGTITTMQQIAADALDIQLDKVRVTEADTLYTPADSVGTQASRVTYVCGAAVKEAGEKLRHKLIDAFCKLKSISPDDVITSQGYIYEKSSSQKYSYSDIVVEFEKTFLEDMSVYVKYKSPANPASFAACFAEIVVDKYTGLVDIIDFLAVHDIGKSINPMLVEGQIQGGAQFSLGMALTEDIEIDKKGNVKSTNFSKYHILNSTSMPKVRTLTIEANEPFGPYGAKSVGEMATVAPAPAIINAINFALDSNIITYPATPELIINELNKKIK
ncbi:xanthine dehydrogenase family protein molybdopterin-binding subunit [Tissierella sp. Yu-01]|uniref:xanthine dehydrogenase family protein molybdopterin-binding subunit n=1 Tax=Tissierella sp. Yu-01 TaxID=3035694 RepID=UPI00240CE4F7|nr:xanthine dehydrogenase family protein molybdopterin-binding subunit [Tissierella sp. Yu-01]WFA09083.1 xanthine dehydrogenase family protein molybdopterin-binding subunit [Tissierella sp. Yu-01]